MISCKSNPQNLLDALSSSEARIRFSAAKTLLQLSEGRPALLYPYLERLAALLHHPNSILRWNAIRIIGNLAAADTEAKLDRMLDDYLAPISGKQLIDAAITIRGAGAIAAAKPYLAGTVAEHILGVERATYATPECRNVAIGHALNVLANIYDVVENKRSILLFAARQTANPRPATRKKAERFLRLHPAADKLPAAAQSPNAFLT